MMFEMFEKHDKTNLQTVLQTVLQTHKCSYDDFDGTDGGDFDFL